MKEIDIVKKYITEELLHGEDIDLKDDLSFYESGLLDSIGVIDLISFIQDRFDIEFESKDLRADNLDSINNIKKFLDRKLNQK